MSDSAEQGTLRDAGGGAAGPPDQPHRAAEPQTFLLDISTLMLRLIEALTVLVASNVLLWLLGDRVSMDAEAYRNATFIGMVFYAGLAEVTGAYDVDVRFSVRQAWRRVLTSWTAMAIFMLTLSFLFKTADDYSRAWGVGWFLLGAASLCAVRGVMVAWMRRLKTSGIFNQRVAIFGAGPQGDRLARYIHNNPKLTITLIGFFDDRGADRLPQREMDLPFCGTLTDLTAAIRRGEIDQVIVALPWSAESRLQTLASALAVTPVRIRLAPDLASFAFAHRPLVMLGDLPALTLFERPLSGFDQVVKRTEDLVLGTLILILISPLLLATAIAIKMDSEGPVFFRQNREGFNNSRFRIWKFRSMRVEKCENDGIKQATRDDDRITRVGRFIRRTSIDELPQLFNVLRGEMSLVGPRPHAPSTRAGERLFHEIIESYAARHNVKPGITGWAQVCGWRGETATEEKLLKRLEHDLYYIENWSLPLDIYIIIKTAATSLFSRIAY